MPPSLSWLERLIVDQDVPGWRPGGGTIPPLFKINEPESGLFYFDGLAQFAVCTIVDQDLIFSGYNRIPCIALGKGCGG